MRITKKAEYCNTEIKSVQPCFLLGQVVPFKIWVVSFKKFTLCSYLVSLWMVYCPQCLQYLFTSKRVGFGVLDSLIE